MTDEKKLLSLAKLARENAYAPYSHFRVGAALLTADGKVYTGANIENSSFGLTVCAERNALFKAVENGERAFVAIAVVGGKDLLEKRCYPCGACRQVLKEFCKDDFKIVLGDEEDVEIKTLGQLLPFSFELEK